jgi:hypothetical protein
MCGCLVCLHLLCMCGYFVKPTNVVKIETERISLLVIGHLYMSRDHLEFYKDRIVNMLDITDMYVKLQL